MKSNPQTHAGWAAMATLLFLMPSVGAGQEEERSIDAKADQALHDMSTYLSKLEVLGLEAEESFDDVPLSGPRLELSHRRAVVVQKPNHIVGDVRGDEMDRSIWYDGKTLSLLDKKHNVYAVSQVPDSIDAMLDYVAEEFDVVIPLTDFLYSDVYDTLTRDVLYGTYAGLHHVGDVPCHHLVFEQEWIDWQIWIEADDTPLPRKLVINYKQEPGEPRYAATILRWNLSPELSDDVFRFEPPVGAEKMDMHAIEPAGR
jgi:hypothetical protein